MQLGGACLEGREESDRSLLQLYLLERLPLLATHSLHPPRHTESHHALIRHPLRKVPLAVDGPAQVSVFGLHGVEATLSSAVVEELRGAVRPDLLFAVRSTVDDGSIVDLLLLSLFLFLFVPLLDVLQGKLSKSRCQRVFAAIGLAVASLRRDCIATSGVWWLDEKAVPSRLALAMVGCLREGRRV